MNTSCQNTFRHNSVQTVSTQDFIHGGALVGGTIKALCHLVGTVIDPE